MDNQWEKRVGEVLSTQIGMKEWLDPQISLHWPKNTPKCVGLKKIKFSRPGQASTLIPILGTVQECNTSPEVTTNRRNWFPGTTTRLSTSSKRKSPKESSLVGIINLSNSTSEKSL